MNNLFFLDKRGRHTRGVPNHLMMQNNMAARINPTALPSLEEAVRDHHQNGGRLTDPHTFGIDALGDYPDKARIRQESFFRKYNSFDEIFNHLCVKCLKIVFCII